jgi:hypothetical protein
MKVTFKDALTAARYTLKAVSYGAQALTGVVDRLSYEWEQESNTNPKIPIRSQADAHRVAEGIRRESIKEMADRVSGIPMDDHGPNISGGSVADWQARHIEEDEEVPEED